MIFDDALKSRPIQKSLTEDPITLAQLVDALGLQGVKPKQLSEATYFACLRILSESLGKLPLKLTQSTDERGTTTLKGHPLYKVFRYRPNPFETAASFWSGCELYRNHFGNSYVRIQTLKNNEIRLWKLPSDQVDIWWDNSKILAEVPHIWYRWSAPNGKMHLFSEEEILHFRTWLSFDGISGLSVREILKFTIDGSLSSQQMLNKLYDNGMAGKAVLQYTGDLSPELQATFAQNLQNYIDGKVDGTKNLIPMPLGTQLTPLEVKLADSQFVEIRKYTALQIAAAFGVKPDQINDYSKSSYSSSEAQQVAFLVDTLLWMIGHYEQEISYKMLAPEEIASGFEFRFNPGVLMRATTDKQMEALTKAVTGMIMTPDEARSHIDMCHMPGGNQLYAGNGSVLPLTMAGKQYDRKGGNTDE